MSLTGWLLFFLIIQVIHFAGTWKLYQKAGRQGWQAAIPVYNAFILMRIINRPWWWTILLFVPVVNLIMFPVLWVETIRSFGFVSRKDTVLVILTLGLYIFYFNYTNQGQYKGNRSLQARSKLGETVSSILFAVVAATIVHTYVMQPFTIPTPSLEKSLLVGDFLFVSKFHYGARLPQTTVSFPMVHDTIPLVKTKSYLQKPQLPYYRLPGFESVERNDIVVFNWPTDTVRMFRDKSGKHYDKPIDKKSNYVKRCVGIAGDSLMIENGIVYVNDVPLQLPERADVQRAYLVKGKEGEAFNPRWLKERYKISSQIYWENESENLYRFMGISDESLKKFKNHPKVASIERYYRPKSFKNLKIFPNNGKVDWNIDQFGPVYIPEKGATIKLTADNFSIYKRVIEVYEGSEMGLQNKLSLKDDQVYLNDEAIDDYTFKQNYYWMMGDNRYNSEDSRFWGFVPHTHIVGKPVFIWLSIDGSKSGLFDKIRTSRVFTTVSGEGERVSYFPYFAIALVIFIGYRYYRKRKKSDG
ncbi:MAG: signal peptidase I [Psychroflexus sp.]|nr:signal peptidase I [Psychroflexus sp.]